ncbi:MAG TPA: hypothetical protein VI485_02420 [Vicinamibacterales bacterium]|nr:hypothetical protein [Vicinamibacterales bacterium]
MPRRAYSVVVFLLVFGALATPASSQTPSAADGPWSGQAQCVLSVRGPNYQDDQTHTWRITGGPPKISGVFRLWPAVWSVQGGGRRQIVVPGRAAAAGASGPSETWTTNVPETSAPLAIWELAGGVGRIRIGSQHGILVARQGFNGREMLQGAEKPFTAASEEWEFPVAEDKADATTIGGTRTRTLGGRRSGWRQALDVVTTETCTWNFTKRDAAAAVISRSGSPTPSDVSIRAAGPPTIQTPTPAPTTTGPRERTLPPGALSGAALPPATTTPTATLLPPAILTVTLPPVTVTYPKGGETVTIGQPITITYSNRLPANTGFTADVSYDGGATWVATQANTATGTVNWTFCGPATTHARVRVKSLDGSSVDESDADFTIAAATTTPVRTVRVLVPNGGELWPVGIAADRDLGAPLRRLFPGDVRCELQR